MKKRSIFQEMRPRNVILGLGMVAVVAFGALQWLKGSVWQQMEIALAEDALSVMSEAEPPATDQLAARASIASAARLEEQSGAVAEQSQDTLSRQVPQWFESLVVDDVPEQQFTHSDTGTTLRLTADPQAFLGAAWSLWLGATLGALALVLLAPVFGVKPAGGRTKPRRRVVPQGHDNATEEESDSEAAEGRSRELGVAAETDVAVLERLPERMADAVIVCDTNGMIQYANQQAHRLFEYEQNDLVGRSVSRLVPPWLEGAPAEVFAGIPDSAEHGAWVEHEARRLTRRGQLIDVSIACAPLDETSLNPKGQVCVVRDVASLRKRMEKADLIRRATDGVQEGILIVETSTDHRAAYANEAAVQMLGLDEGTIIDRPLGPVLSRLSDSVNDCITRVMDSGDGESDWMVVEGDDRSLTYHVSIAPVLSNESNRVSHLAIIIRDFSDLHRDYQTLQRDQKWLGQLLRDNPLATCITDQQDRITDTNITFDELFGRSPSGQTGRGLDELIAEQPLQQVHEALNRAPEFRHYVQFTVADEQRTAELKVVKLEALDRYLWFFNDVTERLSTAQQLAAETERVKVTLGSIGDSVVTTNSQGVIDYINPVAETLTGWGCDEAVGLPVDQVIRFHEEDSDDVISSPLGRALRLGRTLRVDRQAMLRDAAGNEHAVKLTAAPIRDRGGDIIGGVLTFHDVTEMRRTARRLAYEARHDALTGLLNKREFFVRLEDALDTAHHDGMSHALGYLDLDHFKAVNDAAGHAAGDELLKQLTEEIKGNLRRTDLIARLGGDEFAILFYGCTLDDARKVADAIVKSVSRFRFDWGDQQFEVGVSIGVVDLNGDSVSAEGILEQADKACYQSKGDGRNQVSLAGESRQQPGDRWADRLARAVAEDELVLYQQFAKGIGGHEQPVYREALVRLRQPDTDHLMLPEEFFPPARRHGFLRAIDEWVVGNIFDWLAAHDRQVREKVGVNLNITSITDSGFADFVIQQARRTGIRPQQVVFEMDESEVMTRLSGIKSFVERLREEGFGFALQEFTFSRSSFDYLQELPLDYLKLDSTLCADLEGRGEQGRVMIDAIVRIAHLAGIGVIATQVATHAGINQLMDLELDGVQGHKVSVPEPLGSDL
ncbi:MAG: EAL domain-containing protein [Pseudomonadota bacterium]